MANDMHTDGRDLRSGTYDPISPAGKQQPHQVKDSPTAHEAAQHGADVRSQPLAAIIAEDARSGGGTHQQKMDRAKSAVSGCDCRSERRS